MNNQQVESLLVKELQKSFDKEISTATGVPLWANLLYFLRLFNEGKFTGNLSMRMVGHVVYGVRIQNQEISLEEILGK